MNKTVDIFLHIDKPNNFVLSGPVEKIVGWVSCIEKIRDLDCFLNGESVKVSTSVRHDVDTVYEGRYNVGFEIISTQILIDEVKSIVSMKFIINKKFVVSRIFNRARALCSAKKSAYPLFWMHIPKTAGTSVWVSLSDRFGTNNSIRVYQESDTVPPGMISSLPNQYLNNIEIFFGHYAFGLHDIVGEPARYATVLREPQSLIRSYLAYTGVTSDCDPFLDNPLTRFLCGIGLKEQQVGRGDLELAQSNLLKFFVHVGFADKIAQSEAWLRGVFGDSVRDMTVENVTKAEKCDALHSFVNLELDVELYAWCLIQEFYPR